MKPLEVGSFMPKIHALNENAKDGVIGNPMYVAVILTVLVLIVITFIIRYDCVSTKQYMKLFIYILMIAGFLLTMHHNVHVEAITNEFKKNGVNNIYNAIDSVGASNVMPSYPVQVQVQPTNAASSPPINTPIVTGEYEPHEPRVPMPTEDHFAYDERPKLESVQLNFGTVERAPVPDPVSSS